MKVYIITNSTWNIVNFRKELINKMYDMNIEIILSAPKDKYFHLIDKNKFKYVDLTYSRKSQNIFSNLYIIFFYFMQFLREKPDKILLFTIKPNIFCSLSAIFFKKIKIYNFITGLGTLFFENNLKKKFLLNLYRFALLRSDKVIFQNHYDQNFFLDNNVIHQNKSIIISGSGVDSKKFKFSNINSNKFKKFSFLCISRLIAQKGIREYIEASKLIIKNFPQTEFILMGQIDKDNKSSFNLEELLKDNKFIKIINFEFDVYKYLKNCDCFVLPSYREGTSRAIMEAASIGRPIITSDVPGCNNIVKDEFNGYLCKPKSINSLYAAMEKMINTNFVKRKEMSIRSREIITKNFDVNIINNQIINILNEI